MHSLNKMLFFISFWCYHEVFFCLCFMWGTRWDKWSLITYLSLHIMGHGCTKVNWKNYWKQQEDSCSTPNKKIERCLPSLVISLSSAEKLCRTPGCWIIVISSWQSAVKALNFECCSIHFMAQLPIIVLTLKYTIFCWRTCWYFFDMI